jgi:hypothetical protein
VFQQQPPVVQTYPRLIIFINISAYIYKKNIPKSEEVALTVAIMG